MEEQKEALRLNHFGALECFGCSVGFSAEALSPKCYFEVMSLGVRLRPKTLNPTLRA